MTATAPPDAPRTTTSARAVARRPGDARPAEDVRRPEPSLRQARPEPSLRQARPEPSLRQARPEPSLRQARPEPLFRHLVGGILRERREAQGRTLRDVAREARVSVAYLSEVERGRKEASSEVLVAVCRALGMGLADLLREAHGALVGAARPVVVDLTERTSGGERAEHPLAAGPATRAKGSAVLRVA